MAVTLSQAADELERLDTEAKSYENSTGRYIRPIAVVRVERTGRDQRTVSASTLKMSGNLTHNLGVSSENPLKTMNSDGKSTLRIFAIITKSALMEGWDCPFAYLLVMLDNTQAQRAITQLVGRVMRQPHAQFTGRESLDQCYVYCNNVDVGTVVTQVKNGLELEGLTGLGDEVMGASDSREPAESRGQQQINAETGSKTGKSTCPWSAIEMAIDGFNSIIKRTTMTGQRSNPPTHKPPRLRTSAGNPQRLMWVRLHPFSIPSRNPTLTEPLVSPISLAIYLILCRISGKPSHNRCTNALEEVRPKQTFTIGVLTSHICCGSET